MDQAQIAGRKGYAVFSMQINERTSVKIDLKAITNSKIPTKRRLHYTGCEVNYPNVRSSI
ncbi:hypothetical protein JW877_07785 [bacterium]|nr:hypothetical protein [bacterium]